MWILNCASFLQGSGGDYGARDRDMPSSSSGYNLRGGDDRFYGDRENRQENRTRERYDGGGYGAARAVERRTSGYGGGGTSSRRKSVSDVEHSRASNANAGDEDAQLQIALQLSREEAEKVCVRLPTPVLCSYELFSLSSPRCDFQQLSRTIWRTFPMHLKTFLKQLIYFHSSCGTFVNLHWHL